ncbi:hypothetical protein EKO27_g5201 [Xylaria grammica]|uniref:Uncharacterized protein n=1 Tax=Xylaria grammica TaxID=363999 RepID=A0A439D657_9PEZI|nr:hypothetical protein EKO27_g5201 [Xylaria grammica]
MTSEQLKKEPVRINGRQINGDWLYECVEQLVGRDNFTIALKNDIYYIETEKELDTKELRRIYLSGRSLSTTLVGDGGGGSEKA